MTAQEIAATLLALPDCERCGGEGMTQYKHVVGGVCFACGRTPAGKAATAVELAAARERRICDIASLLRRAEQERAAGDLADWWLEVRDGARAKVRTAPADVCARAVAAFVKAGLAV